MNPKPSLNQSSTTPQIQTNALYSLPASFYRWQVFGLIASGLLFLWLSRNEQLDWAISNYWFDAASGHFPWQNNHWLDLINHRLLKIGVITGAVLALFWGIYRRNPRMIVTMLLVGIGPLVVGILKATSAHSCPWDLIEYGGKAMSYPLFGAIPAVPGPGRCFPGGHASSGFAVMALFFLFAMLLGAALQITNTFGNPFLHDFASNPLYQDSISVRYPAVLLSLSQISEVFFILTIPFFLRRYGIKQVMLISMAAWTLRFLFLAYGTPVGFGFVLLLLSMIVYGCAFDFFNISGAIFVEKEADSRIRASAQGLFMTMVNGIGAYLGAIASGEVVDFFTHDGVKDWQSIWLIFALYTLVLGIIFALTFNYQHRPEEYVGPVERAH